MYILYIFVSFEISKIPSSETLIQLKHAVALSLDILSYLNISTNIFYIPDTQTVVGFLTPLISNTGRNDSDLN